ncbi:MAG: hypothetical protein ABJZ55_01975 [Fuerstiella sp.]
MIPGTPNRRGRRQASVGGTAITASDLLIAWEGGDPIDLTAGIQMLGSPLAGVSESVGPWDAVWPADRIRNGSEIPDPTSWGAYSVAFVCKILGRDGRRMFSSNGGDAIAIGFSAVSPIGTATYETYVGGEIVAEGPESDPPNATDYQSVIFSKTGPDSAELFINGVSAGTATGGVASSAWSIFMDTGQVKWASLWIANKTWTAVEAAEHYNSGNFLSFADLTLS